MKDIQYVLYNIKNTVCHLECKINLDILENAIGFIAPFQVKGHRSVPLHGTVQRSLNSVSISYHVTVSNHMTRIYIGVIYVSYDKYSF